MSHLTLAKSFEWNVVRPCPSRKFHRFSGLFLVLNQSRTLFWSADICGLLSASRITNSLLPSSSPKVVISCLSWFRMIFDGPWLWHWSMRIVRRVFSDGSSFARAWLLRLWVHEPSLLFHQNVDYFHMQSRIKRYHTLKIVIWFHFLFKFFFLYSIVKCASAQISISQRVRYWWCLVDPCSMSRCRMSRWRMSTPICQKGFVDLTRPKKLCLFLAMTEPEPPAPAVTPALQDEELAATFTNDSAMMIAFDTQRWSLDSVQKSHPCFGDENFSTFWKYEFISIYHHAFSSL